MVTAVTIVNQDNVTFTFQDGDVNKITCDVLSEVEQNGLSGQGFNNSHLADFEGVRKVLTLTGALTAATTTRTSSGTVTTIKQQKDWLEGLQNGLQSPKAFTSRYESCNIMVSKFSTTDDVDIHNQLPFTLSLFVGAL